VIELLANIVNDKQYRQKNLFLPSLNVFLLKINSSNSPSAF